MHLRSQLFIVLISLCFGAKAFGKSYHWCSLAESVFYADTILAAYVTKNIDGTYQIVVRESLLGEAEPEFTYIPKVSRPFQTDDVPRTGVGIYFFVHSKGSLHLIYTARPRNIHEIPTVRRIIAMRRSPGKYLNNPRIAASPDFIELLTLIFGKKDFEDGVTKKAVLDYLDRTLTSPDPKVVGAALKTLLDLRSVNTLPVLPLLEHSDSSVRQGAIHFLHQVPDPAAFDTLCRLIDGLKDARSPDRYLASDIADILGAIGDPRAAPVLNRAVQRGFLGVCAGLGHLGDRSELELMLSAKPDDGFSGPEDGLRIMVHRSNKPPQEWMLPHTGTQRSWSQEQPLWLEWWRMNGSDFKIVAPPKALPTTR